VFLCDETFNGKIHNQFDLHRFEPNSNKNSFKKSFPSTSETFALIIIVILHFGNDICKFNTGKKIEFSCGSNQIRWTERFRHDIAK